MAELSIDRAARAIHENYRTGAARRGETVESNASMEPWADLPAHLRRSNIAQAENIDAMLVAVGARLGTAPPAVEFAFTEDEVQRLAELEHQRWVRERTAAGFSHGPHRDGTHHPDLVDWSELSPQSRQKDVDAIRALPDLLAAQGLHLHRTT